MRDVFVKSDNPKPIKTAGMSAGLVNDNEDDLSKAKEACGLCPVCNNSH